MWFRNKKADKQQQANAPHGFVFGIDKKDGGYYARPEIDDGHILVVGGVGSGKTSRIAIPTLRYWNKRVFAIDVKSGELYEKTKKYRPNIKVFNPTDPNAWGYDPYYRSRTTEKQRQAQEAQAIANALIPIPENTPDKFWLASARNFLTGMILYFFSLGKSFVKTIQIILNTPLDELIEKPFKNKEDIKDIEDEDIEVAEDDYIYYLTAFMAMDMKTLSGIFAEVSRHIIIFATDKDVRSSLLKDKNITPEDLENDNDIYICVPEHLLQQWENLIALIISQFLRHFQQRQENNKTPILFLLDEFPRLGKIEGITHALSTLRSKRITICPIIQSLAQLDLTYNKETRQVIADTCSYKVVLNIYDPDSQEYFSRLYGTYDKTKLTHSKNYSAIIELDNGSSTSRTTEEKRMIKPEEFATLKDVVLYTPYENRRIDRAPYATEN